MAIVMTPARMLNVGDVFSTDGYVVRSVDDSHGAVITIVAALNGHVKYAQRAPDALLPVYVADDSDMITFGRKSDGWPMWIPGEGPRPTGMCPCGERPVWNSTVCDLCSGDHRRYIA